MGREWRRGRWWDYARRVLVTWVCPVICPLFECTLHFPRGGDRWGGAGLGRTTPRDRATILYTGSIAKTVQNIKANNLQFSRLQQQFINFRSVQ